MRRGRVTSRRQLSRRRGPSRLTMLWAELLRPALVIAFVGVGAVIYISACARVSIMEWDLHTLEQRAAADRDDCLELQRRIADACKSSVIRDHVAENGLTREAATAEVAIDSVPRELLSELPRPTDAGDTELAGTTPAAAGGSTLIAAAPPGR